MLVSNIPARRLRQCLGRGASERVFEDVLFHVVLVDGDGRQRVCSRVAVAEQRHARAHVRLVVYQ